MHLATRLLCAAILTLLTAPTRGQADFAEGFENNGPPGQDGPQNLISRGWIFSNQSEPTNGPAWYDGNGFGGEPFEGQGYLATDSLATDYFGGPLSVWAVLPAIPNQRTGDDISVWILGGGSPTADTHFEIRYAPSGGTNTGSDAGDVGDFTVVLYSGELPISQSGYQQILADLPGNGRVALRFWSPFIMTAFGRGANFALDSLTVGGEPEPPCGVPIPQPGETAVWTLARSPYTVCEDLLIPEGSTVLIEPGVRVRFDPGRTLRVEGEITAHGTLTEPILFDGDNGPAAGLVVTGHADLAFAELGVQMHAASEHAVLELRDSTVLSGAEVWGVPDITVVERCRFIGGSLGNFSALSGSLRLADSTFTAGGYANIIGVMYVDNVEIDGGPLMIAGEGIASPNYLDNISVSNYQSGAGVTISGNNFMLGENFVTQNNLYPLAMTSLASGILPGSVLPRTGNTWNHVPVAGLKLGANLHWANTGIPYVVEGFPENYGGSLTIAPGTTVRFGPGAGAFLVRRSDLIAQGTAEEPIVFERADDSTPWFGLKWVDNFLARQRHVIFDGAEIAVQSDNSELLLDHATIRDNLEGTLTVTGGNVSLRNSMVLNNGVGMGTTATGRIDAQHAGSPNIFAGNALAVDYNNTRGSIPALDHNWWNSPNGPTSSENPGGDGDPVEGLQSAWFTPFLHSPPAQQDDPPRVDLEPVYYMINSGEKVILRWDASDDSAIVSQRVEFADHAFPDQFGTVATLGPQDRSFEFTVPIVLPTNQYTTPAGIRVVAVDDSGQEWLDEALVWIPYQEDFTPVYQEVRDVPDVVHPHDRLDVCWLPGGTAKVYVALDDMLVTDYHGGAGSCLPIGATMPFVSTDTARFLVLTTYGAGGREVYSFSDYFSIRPDALIGDTPPTVELLSPSGGEAFRGGGTIPVWWAAADDEEVRSIAIQATYDGGKTWHSVERRIDPGLTSFDWVLPASTGIDDVRVRVVATDLRFQTSSATSGGFSILPGEPGDCPADFDGDGLVNTQDVLAFLNAWTAREPEADFNGDGTVNTQDVLAFLNAWSAGC